MSKAIHNSYPKHLGRKLAVAAAASLMVAEASAMPAMAEGSTSQTKVDPRTIRTAEKIAAINNAERKTEEQPVSPEVVTEDVKALVTYVDAISAMHANDPDMKRSTTLNKDGSVTETLSKTLGYDGHPQDVNVTVVYADQRPGAEVISLGIYESYFDPALLQTNTQVQLFFREGEDWNIVMSATNKGPALFKSTSGDYKSGPEGQDPTLYLEQETDLVAGFYGELAIFNTAAAYVIPQRGAAPEVPEVLPGTL